MLTDRRKSATKRLPLVQPHKGLAELYDAYADAGYEFYYLERPIIWTHLLTFTSI